MWALLSSSEVLAVQAIHLVFPITGNIRAEDDVACVKDSRAQEILHAPSSVALELSGLRGGHKLEPRRSLSCLFLLASPPVAKGVPGL